MLINSKWISSESIKLYTEKKSQMLHLLRDLLQFSVHDGLMVYFLLFAMITTLHLIVAALELWGRYIHSVLFLTDNQAVVEVIRSEVWSWPP